MVLEALGELLESPSYVAPMVCGEPTVLVGVYVTEHEPEDRVQLGLPKLPDPLDEKLSTVPVGEPELVTVIVQDD